MTATNTNPIVISDDDVHSSTTTAQTMITTTPHKFHHSADTTNSTRPIVMIAWPCQHQQQWDAHGKCHGDMMMTTWTGRRATRVRMMRRTTMRGTTTMMTMTMRQWWQQPHHHHHALCRHDDDNAIPMATQWWWWWRGGQHDEVAATTPPWWRLQWGSQHHDINNNKVATAPPLPWWWWWAIHGQCHGNTRMATMMRQQCGHSMTMTMICQWSMPQWYDDNDKSHLASATVTWCWWQWWGGGGGCRMMMTRQPQHHGNADDNDDNSNDVAMPVWCRQQWQCHHRWWYRIYRLYYILYSTIYANITYIVHMLGLTQKLILTSFLMVLQMTPRARQSWVHGREIAKTATAVLVWNSCSCSLVVVFYWFDN